MLFLKRADTGKSTDINSVVATEATVSGSEQSAILAEQRYDVLSNLSGSEKQFLQAFFDGDTKSIRLSMNHGVALGLEAKGLLIRPTQVLVHFQATWIIHDWVWKMIKKHPAFLT